MTTARDTIVDALDIESFVRCAGGLKALNMTAQGNALGVPFKNISSPERAAQTSREHFVLPFQGVSSGDFISRGVAPGCLVIALSARNACGCDKSQTRLKSPNVIWSLARHSRRQRH
jgi:hypothetical protein